MTYLADDELRRLLLEIETRFSPSTPLSTFEKVERLESRTSMIYVVSGPGIDTAVVKAGKDWDPETAERVYRDLVALERLFEWDTVDIGVAPVLGWSPDPPSVCLGFIEGQDLSGLLSWREGYLSSEVETAMDHTGAALGLYHSDGVASVARGEVSPDTAALEAELEDIARKVGLPRSPMSGYEMSGLVARRYGDFAPYNIRISPDGKVWVLDQPSPPTYAPVHHDVSYFLGRVEGRLGRYEPGIRRRRGAVQGGLEAVFMAAYARTGPAPLDRPTDRALIAMYRSHRSLMTARKRVSQRRLREVPRYLRSGLHWRREARRLI